MVSILPNSLYQNLEFDKISNLLKEYCLIEDTRQHKFPLQLETDLKTLEHILDEVLEFKSTYEQSALIPVLATNSITEHLEYLSLEGYVLELESLLDILKALQNLEELQVYFNELTRRNLAPLAYQQYKKINYTSDLYKEFKVLFDDKGQIRPDASPALKSISSAIKSKEYEIDQVFKSLLFEYRKNGWLSEAGESVRNNRRVVAVASEHKRKIKGIIHDESTTGRTTFIEPESIIEKNNELFSLEIDYQNEILRLLKTLSASCHSHHVMLVRGWEVILYFDFIRAKALFAVKYEGLRPEIYDKPQLKIKTGRHPLLFLKNKPLSKTTIPFDLILIGENRILILSGPNAGGKSVVMKATMLMQMMLQAGMLVPVHEASEMGIFHSFLGDIGDHQSLEEDLSTYSSRLLLMKQFLDIADHRSLMVIDEFGSGTDPKLGGAIAESILLALNKKKVFGVITTHYSNLKVLAFKTKGLINGAMVFDTEHLKPTFQLKVGRPGSSYAFEVASRSGLDDEVIEHAKKRTHQDQKELETLLIDLQRDKLILEDQLHRVKTKEDNLDKLTKSYQQMHDDYEIKKKKLKLDQKSWELNASKEMALKVSRALKEIKTIPKNKEATTVLQKLEQVKTEVEIQEKDLHKLATEVHMLEKASQKSIEEGSYVRLKNGTETGQVQSIRKNQAEVSLGSMIISIPLKDLILVRQPEMISTPSSKTKAILAEEKSVDPTLDIRGMSKAQAIELLQNYLDRAMLSNVHEVKILHGKGSGILRDVVKQQAKKYKGIGKISHPPQEAGGDGVSIVSMA